MTANQVLIGKTVRFNHPDAGTVIGTIEALGVNNVACVNLGFRMYWINLRHLTEVRI